MAILNKVFTDAFTPQGIQSPPVPTEVQAPATWTQTWANLGVYVGPQAPLEPKVFEQWLATGTGYWAWIQT